MLLLVMRSARLWFLLVAFTFASLPRLAAGPIDPAPGGVIVLVGGGQGERLLRETASRLSSSGASPAVT
ncbi:hypothetical protein EMGBD4_10290 [Verrucomicrobiota bacterium]|nr:hypothetical protein EMGBD4_10290 [Verrucomicrobiota bacterium]